MESSQKFLISWQALFAEKAKIQGHSNDYIDKCLSYASELQKKNLPIIFDRKHLSFILNIHEDIFVDNIFSHYYRNYTIKKRNHRGTRTINSPVKWLKVVQRWIYENILLKYRDVSPSVFGFLPNGYNMREAITIKSNAELHVNKSWIINIDIKDFFPSIRKESVVSYFSTLGYTDEVVEALSMLCLYKDGLPQGAPTSPMLSNIICHQLDSRMQLLAEKYDATYTRYADDLTFSGNGMVLDKGLIYDEIKRCGFRPNYSKTKVRLRGQKMMVTGLTVSMGVHVAKKYRKEVWQELHFCEKFGVVSHMAKHNEIRQSNQGFYKEWLLGRIMYIRSIDKECGSRMLEKFNSLKWL